MNINQSFCSKFRRPFDFGYNILIPSCHEKHINDIYEEMGSCYKLTDEDHDHRAYFPKDSIKMPSPVHDSMWGPGLCFTNYYKNAKNPH